MADCNFTYGGMGGDYGVGGNKKMLDLCQQVGIKALLNDHRLFWQMTEGDDWQKLIGEVVADYGSHPALFGYFIQDEPGYELFRPLGMVNQELQKQDPKHLPYINLFPTYATSQQLGTPTYADHLDKYLSIVKPWVLSYDHYCLRADGSDGPDYFENLGFIRDYAMRYGAYPWNIIQAMNYAPASMRQPNDVEMRWQVYTSLAYGIKGIMYFVYWSYNDHPVEVGIVDHGGKPAKLYPVVKQLNGEMKALGKTLLGLTSTGVYHTGDIPQGATRLTGDAIVHLPQDKPLVIGFFRDAQGADFALIANRSQRQATEFDATFNDSVVAVTRISPEDGSDIAMPVAATSLAIKLAPGDGMLLRLKTEFRYAVPPKPAMKIAFEFNEDGNLEEWGGLNSLGEAVVKDGTLTMTFTGEDPFFVRSWVRIPADTYTKIKVRMKLPPCNKEGQFFWTTGDSPGFADDKYMNFGVVPDGAWHEYEIPVATHAMWKGHPIRAIRLDPTTGGATPGSKVEIDWIRGE